MGEPGPLDPSRSSLAEVLADYSLRVAAGEPITSDDLVARYPALAEALRSHFASAASAGETHDNDVPELGTQYVKRATQATIPPRKAPAAKSCSLPEQFGRYRVSRCLGEGTMGAVYLADDTQLERQVALKIPKFTDDGDDELAQRFYREARAAAMLRHSNLCPVYDAGEIDGVRYLSMAYIEGRPLSEVLTHEGPLSNASAATFVLKLARALAAAHARGVIHRDLKPSNIMIDAHDEPIIMDFGLARRINKEDSRLTQDGTLMGSPAYMSPEQVEGDIERMGPPSDVYSLGIILYELLTGVVPFKGSIAAVMGQILSAEPKKPSSVKAGINPALEAVCLKMIAKRMEDRFASMTDVVRALEAYLAGRPTGVVLREPDLSSTLASAISSQQVAPVRGIVIAPWMLMTAVLIIVAGFGVTWQLIARMMKQQADEIKVSAQTREALDSGKAKAVINGKELDNDQLKQPIELQPGKNTLSVVHEGEKAPANIGIMEVTPGDEQKNFAVYDKTKGEFVRKRSHRLVAEVVLALGGKVKLKGSTDSLEKVDDLPANKDLPDNKLELSEINLQEVKSVSPEDLKRIGHVTSLERLVLPTVGVSKKQRAALRQELPNCAIEPPE
jgi:serine/threonine protein kinase